MSRRSAVPLQVAGIAAGFALFGVPAYLSVPVTAVAVSTLVLRGGFDLALAKPLTAAELKLGNTKLLGVEVYTHYLYPLQLAAVLLLVAIIAAIALTLRERKDSRHMDPSQQVRVKRADRVRIVSMAAEVDQPGAPVADGQGGEPAAPGTVPKGAA